MGLRRVKKTVNFDALDVYHLYYADETGSAGTVVTYLPFQHIARGGRGAGEVAEAVFSVPKGLLGYWNDRFAGMSVSDVAEDDTFGEKRLRFVGPDGEGFAMTEVDGDKRLLFAGGTVPVDGGVHDFHRVDDAAARWRRHRRTVEIYRL